VLPERLAVRLLAVLAAAAGCLDAVCVARLGGPFASVITGNLVQLGRGIAADGRLAARAAVAIAGYAVGVAAGSVGLRSDTTGWRRRTSLLGMVEFALLSGVAAGWLASGGQPDAYLILLLLVLAAAAMGVQSAVTVSTGVRGASTTYLTGTLTALVGSLTSAPRRVAGRGGGAVRLAALLCGATVGAFLLRVAPLWAPAVPAVLVGAALVAAARPIRAWREES
jgi:uncharacterized membrane protein YoaK (UPF0700 family)